MKRPALFDLFSRWLKRPARNSGDRASGHRVSAPTLRRAPFPDARTFESDLDRQLREIGPPRDPYDFMRPGNEPDWL